MEQIKDIISGVIGKLSVQNSGHSQQIQQAWQKTVGEKVAKHTFVEGLKDGKLFVKVDSPVAAFQLNLKRNQILRELQKIDNTLGNIVLRVGRIE